MMSLLLPVNLNVVDELLEVADTFPNLMKSSPVLIVLMKVQKHFLKNLKAHSVLHAGILHYVQIYK